MAPPPATLALARRKARTRVVALLAVAFWLPFVAFQQHLLPKPIAALVGRAYFWPTLWLTYIRSLLSGKGLWCSIDDTVVLGVAPLALLGHPEAMHRLGVRAVVNMQDEYAGPEASYERLGIRQLRLPTVDHFEPEMAKLLEAVRLIEASRLLGERVYVHCKAGHGRAGAVALAWLAQSRGVFDAAGLERLNVELAAKRRVREALHLQPEIRAFAAEAFSEKRTKEVATQQLQPKILDTVAGAIEESAETGGPRARTMSAEAATAEAEAAAELAAAIAEAQAAEAEAAEADVQPPRERTMSAEAAAAEAEAAAELAAAIAEAEAAQAEAAEADVQPERVRTMSAEAAAAEADAAAELAAAIAEAEAAEAEAAADAASSAATGANFELARRLSARREKDESGVITGVSQANDKQRQSRGPVVNDELAARLQRQKLKEETGQSSVDAVDKQVQSPKKEAVIDSQLAARLERQKMKELRGEEATVDAVSAASEATPSAPSPERQAQQPRGVPSNAGSPAPTVGGFDAGLAARLQRQKDKEQSGESSVLNVTMKSHEAHGAEGREVAVDPQLAAMLQRQKMKEETS